MYGEQMTGHSRADSGEGALGRVFCSVKDGGGARLWLSLTPAALSSHVVGLNDDSGGLSVYA